MGGATPWKCEVCGYVHRGDEPPSFCPVCGADRDRFELLRVVTAATLQPLATGTWRCSICDHLHTGQAPPEQCSVCGASRNLFVPYAQAAVASASTPVRRLLILGAGIAGVTAAEQARTLAPEVAITLLSREKDAPYYRLNLTRLLADEVVAEALPLKSPAWYAEQRIELLQGEVADIDRLGCLVRLQDGRVLSYDRLILACGAHPFVPALPGAVRTGVLTLRTLPDVRALLALLRPGMRCICIGGGLLGLETAAALRRRGAAVTVLEGFGWLLPRQLPATAGRILQQAVEHEGITVACGIQVEELLGDECVRGVRLVDGREIDCDLVIVTAGVRPNSYLARQAGLKVEGGVVVDDRMTTSEPTILAAGDVAEHRGTLYGIWPAAYAQGMVAGMNAVGVAGEFPGLPPSNRLKVLGLELFSIGQLSGGDASYRLFEIADGASYRGLLCRDKRVVGGALLGDTALAPLFKELVEGGGQLDERPELQSLFPALAVG